MERPSDTVSVMDNETVQKLAKGIMELYEPPLVTISTHLKELTQKQEDVHSTLVSERKRLEDLQHDADLDALMANLATDRERLVSASHSMMELHKRVQSLQIRATNVEKVAKSKMANQKPSGDSSLSGFL